MAKLGINTGSIPNDGLGDSLLDGAVKINSNFNEIYNYFGNGTVLTAIGGTWGVTTVGIHTLKNVGIGTTNPTSSLTVSGNVNISGILTSSSAQVELLSGTNSNYSGVSAVGSLSIGSTQVISSGRELQNITSLDATTTETIESAIQSAPNNFNNLNVSGVSTLGNTIVGGATTQLVVNGDTRITGILTVGSSSITLNGSSNSIKVGSGVTIDGNAGTINATSIVINGTSITGGGVTSITAGSGISVNQSTGNVIITATGGGGGSSQWVSTGAGIHTLSNVGVGTTNPQTKLEISGIIGFTGGDDEFGEFRNNIRIGDTSTGASLTPGSPSHFSGLDNILIGRDAGNATTSGFRNVFIGRRAGRLNTSGSRNTFIGEFSGQSNTTGDRNIFLGVGVGAANTAGTANNFIGNEAGQANTIGGVNNFFGNGAGYSNTEGYNNNYIGLYSAENSTTGFENNFFGTFSGINNTTGSKNTYIGNYTGISQSASNKIVIGLGYDYSYPFDSPDTTKNIQFAVGLRTDTNASKYWLVGDENFNVGIGTTNPTSKLTVSGNVRVTGVVTATSFVGDGSGLTGVVGSGSGVIIKDSGSTVGTAGTIDFGDNLTVSPVSAGVVTVTASGGTSSQWVTTASGIHTLSNVGIATTNPSNTLTVLGSGTSTSQLYVSGFSTFRNNIDLYDGGFNLKTNTDEDLFSISYDTNNDDLIFYYKQSGGLGGSQVVWYIPETSSFVLRNPAVSEAIAEFTTGGSVALYYDGSKKFETIGAGVTVTGTTFTNQLNVSGISTTNTLNVGVGGTVVTTTSDGLVGIGTTNPTSKFEVLGDSLFTGNTKTTGNLGVGNITSGLGVDVGLLIYGNNGLVISNNPGGGGGFYLRTNGDNKWYVDYNSNQFGTGKFELGPNISTPNTTLDTSGNASFSGIITTKSRLNVGTGGTVVTTTSDGLVGIGTTNPTSTLTVKGNTSLETLNVSGVSTFQNNIKIDYNKAIYFGNGNEFYIYRYYGLPGDKTVFYNISGDLQITSSSGLSIDNGSRNYAIFNSSGTALYHTASDVPAVTLRYETTSTGTNVYKDFSVKVNNGNDLFVVKTPGSGLTADVKVGIGTTNPTSNLTVRGGDISVGVSTAHGLILTSANGTQYRLIVSDAGVLSTVAV